MNHTPEFTENELYELNDAVLEVMQRMTHDGQTKSEREHRSLEVLFSAWQKIGGAILDPVVRKREMPQAVRAAIDKPIKIRVRPHGNDTTFWPGMGEVSR